MTESNLELGELGELGLQPENRDVLTAISRSRARAGLTERSAELWAWRAASPDGAVLGFARHADGSPSAAIVGVRHAVWLEGEIVPWIEIVDVFNDFDGGAGLARTRDSLSLGAAFAREFGGAGPERASVLYGLPNRRAHRIQLAKLKTEVLRSENVLSIAPSSVVWTPGSVEVEEVEQVPAEIDDFARSFADGRPALLVRDAERLKWRYRAHPERDYRAAIARRAGRIVGYAVLRIGEWTGRRGGLIVDWLISPDASEAGMELLLWADSATAGADRLTVNVPDKSPEFAYFQGVGFHVGGTGEYLVFRGFQKPYVMSWLFSNWYYTLGDTERG